MSGAKASVQATDWITLAGDGTTPIVQSSARWADFARFTDAVLWLEVRSVSEPAGGSVTLAYETAPAQDERLFRAFWTQALAPTTEPIITKLRTGDQPVVPLARWVRWKVQGTATGPWSVTFRVLSTGGGAAGAKGFDAASLALTGWWRASYAASPWRGAGSAGSSGTRALSQASSPPSTGSAVNGLVPADFNGTDQYLSSTVQNDAYLSVGGSSLFCLFYANSAPSPVSDYSDGTFFTDPANAETTFGFTSSGIGMCLYDGAYKRLNVACGTGAWHLAQFKHDGTNMKARVDSGSWSSLACGTLSFLTPSAVVVGQGYAGGMYFDGRILELGVAATALSDAVFDRIKTYVNARYALSL